MFAHRSGKGLFAAYALASLVPVVALGAALEIRLHQEFDRRALDDALTRAEAIADGRIEPALTGHDLGADLTDGERAQLARITGAMLSDGSVLRLRLRAPAGDIVFDAADRNVTRIPTVDPEVAEAAGGSPVRLLTKLNADEVDGSATDGASAVEAYVAIHDPAAARTDAGIGVLEIYLPYAPFAAAAMASTHRLDRDLAIGLALMWVLLAVVTWSVTRRIRRYARDNAHLALHDQLTGLPNNVWFARELARQCTHPPPSAGASTSESEALELTVIDVARMGEINRTLGPVRGDAFLVEIARRLSDAIGTDAVMARLNGDEFAIIHRSPSTTDSAELASRIIAITAAEIDLGGIGVDPELHIGTARQGPGLTDPETLLRAAELASHAARDSGSHHLHFRPELDVFDPERLALVAELRRAISTDELTLHYQPKIDLVTGEVRSVEALLRWRHPRRGLIAPATFIPIAESTTLIGPLTDWVVGRVARDLSAHDSAHNATNGAGASGYLDGLDVALNVSAANLRDSNLARRVLGILDAHGVDPRRIEIEITETAVVSDMGEAVALLRELHDHGMRIALDDFGQGATSLVSLNRLPLDEIKIDRAFIVNVTSHADRRTIVASVIELGHRLGLTVVAEGIEDQDTADALAAMGCDLGQGYLWSRPLPPDELARWLSLSERSVRSPRAT